MNAKEYLSQAIWLDRIIQNKLEQKERLEAIAEKVTVDFGQEKVSGGNSSKSAMENATVKMLDLHHEINADIDRLIDLKAEIMLTISQLEDVSQQLLLEMRYINNKSWEDVSCDLGFDRSWVLRLHGKALKEIDEIRNKRLKATESDPKTML
jgi:DNA-directed RNA polymerase specialized sigma subunit